jgi:methionyl-tRNA formyltransferase
VPIRLVFMGTADLACASLQALVSSPALQVLAVVTQPDRPKGRDLKPQSSPVKTLALKLHLPVLQPERARHESFLADLRPLAPDLIIVAAYGQILPQTLLDLPRFGCLNVHTSLLPKYRGAAPIQWALLNDDAETGVTIMKMNAGLDTGDILTTQTTAITDTDNAQSLHDRLAMLGAELLVRTIPDHVAGKISPRPQPADGASYARKITKEDGHLDWTQPARPLWNRIRAFTPWPGAFTFQHVEPKPVLLKIWQAEIMENSSAAAPGEILSAGKQGVLVRCGHNALNIQVLQREGSRRLSAAEFLNGHPLKAGDRFTAP